MSDSSLCDAFSLASFREKSLVHENQLAQHQAPTGEVNFKILKDTAIHV